MINIFYILKYFLLEKFYFSIIVQSEKTVKAVFPSDYDFLLERIFSRFYKFKYVHMFILIFHFFFNSGNPSFFLI